MLRLIYLTANAAWVFTFGDSIIKVGDTRFHNTRSQAVQAANTNGLLVDTQGVVKTIDPSGTVVPVC